MRSILAILLIIIVLGVVITAFSLVKEFLKSEWSPIQQPSQQETPLKPISKESQKQEPLEKLEEVKPSALVDDVITFEPKQEADKINVSPYFEKVKISTVKAKSFSSCSLITLSVQSEDKEKINITGWRIRGNKGEIIIPQGIEMFSSYEGILAPQDISVGQYDKIYLLSQDSPLGKNRNFRLNKCFGYFLNDYKIFPSFSRKCPKPKLEEISHLKEYCQEFILKLGTCEIPDYSEDYGILYDNECVSYLRENLKYSSCFKKHSKDENFFDNYWYVYLGEYDIVSKLHDTLYLRDKNGLLIDKYLY